MTCSLAEPIAEPIFPEGYTLRDGYPDPQAWAELYNESFVDHYNFHRQTAEEIQHWQKEADYRPDLNLVAVAPDGTFAAFAWCTIRASDTERAGPKTAWVDLLGTRRGHRRIGLGRAMLLAGLQRMQAAGIEIAWLGVDAASPTGATDLYDKVGFTKAYSRTLYGRKLS
jgi:ribosomal protein S18 acetylase RimI-like enzyme